jgi:hypothetical protein
MGNEDSRPTGGNGQTVKPARIRIVLAQGRKIGGEMRKPQFLLLEGVAASGVTTEDIDRAIASGSASVMRV